MSTTSSTTISEVMTPHPLVVNIDDSLSVALKLMEDNSIRHLPVIAEGKPFSVVSDRELHIASSLPNSGKGLTVGDVCAMEGYIVEEHTLLSSVLKEMFERKLGSVLVTSGGRIAGIFTSVDACSQLYLLLTRSD